VCSSDLYVARVVRDFNKKKAAQKKAATTKPGTFRAATAKASRPASTERNSTVVQAKTGPGQASE
jgi:hypothetical protein